MQFIVIPFGNVYRAYNDSNGYEIQQGIGDANFIN